MTENIKRRFYIKIEFEHLDDSKFLSDKAADCLEELIKTLRDHKEPALSAVYFVRQQCTAVSLMTFEDEKMFEETNGQIYSAMVRHHENS